VKWRVQIPDPQAGVGGIARQQDHFDARSPRGQRIEREELLHEVEGDARLQQFLFVLELVAGIGFDALLLEDAVALLEVEQGPRGNRHHQLAVEGYRHAHAPLMTGITSQRGGRRNGTSRTSIHYQLR